MVGIYSGKAIPNSTKSKYKNDPHCSNLDTSIRGRVVGMVKTPTTGVTRKQISGEVETKERKSIAKKPEKSQQTKRQTYQTQPTGISLQSDLHIDAYLSASTGLSEFDRPPKLKLVSESSGETAWLKPNLLSGSSGNLSLFEEDENLLLNKNKKILLADEGENLVSVMSKEDETKNDYMEPESSLQSACFDEANVGIGYNSRILSNSQLVTGSVQDVSPLSAVSGSTKPPAYQPLDTNSHQLSHPIDYNRKKAYQWQFPSELKSSADNFEEIPFSRRTITGTGEDEKQNYTNTNAFCQPSLNSKSYFSNEKNDKRDFSRNSKLRFPSNKGGYWSPLVKPLSEFMDNELRTKKSSYSAQDEELIKQIDMLLICDFSYRCINIFMVTLEIILSVVILTATSLFIFDELPEDIELIHIMFFNLVMIFTLFALNSYASREVKVNGQCKVNSFLKIYWHLFRKNYDNSFKENYLFLDDWYGDKKYNYIKAKLKEVSIYGSASGIDLHYYRDIDSC